METISNEAQIPERELGELAKRFRTLAGISKAEAGRQLKVSRATIQQAEDYPEVSLTKLRLRMIEKYSPFEVVGPVFILKEKSSDLSPS